ncbi:MAG TPA: T9SS type A sorting domain-containing protein [Bacteroidota bacterium]|nr:T9SS type A sorting domain-containing protein [Bacteroidota bacterium]
MKRSVLLFFLLLCVPLSGNAVTHTINNSGYTFTPASVTINLGDTVSFVLASIHFAVEVDQTTWNADGNTSNGGFTTDVGGGMVVLSQVGTYYYVCGYHYSLGMKGMISVVEPTGVNDPGHPLPQRYELAQNYPNPFNPSTVISFDLPAESQVKLTVVNTQGSVVATLVDGEMPGGSHSIRWSAANFASGLYFYTMEATSRVDSRLVFRQVRKMLVIK